MSETYGWDIRIEDRDDLKLSNNIRLKFIYLTI